MEAKLVKDLMEAYASVYFQQEEVEVIGEEPIQDYRDRRRAAENARGDRGPELSHGGGPSKGKPQPGSATTKSQPRSREFSHGGSSQPRSREFAHEQIETDLFDVILEYLVAEGYADTNQAALAIMANMSEEWKGSIVEQLIPKDKDLESPDYKDAKRIMNQGSGNKGSGHNGDKPGYDPITGIRLKGV